MTVAVIFTGLKRFYNSTKSNHAGVLHALEKKYGITVYDQYRDTANPNCPFDQSGKVQVWDLLTARDQVNEDIIVKIRSDVYFTNSSIDVLCKEIDEVIAGNTDVVYLGIDFLHDYDKIHKRENARDCKKVTDFVIVARKNSLDDTDKVTAVLSTAVKDKSGNKTFFNILRSEARAVKVSCQMYLVRQEYNTLDNWQIYWDWCQQYRKSEQAQEWVKNNQQLIGTF
jgi:hypothetical protein